MAMPSREHYNALLPPEDVQTLALVEISEALSYIAGVLDGTQAGVLDGTNGERCVGGTDDKDK